MPLGFWGAKGTGCVRAQARCLGGWVRLTWNLIAHKELHLPLQIYFASSVGAFILGNDLNKNWERNRN